jgi:transcriptional regulator with XRE-family HTH domain
MSIEPEPLSPQQTGFPELTELGKRIEVLRIQRGLSKQHLARGAGTSRQQLWRVSTGKSELTPPLRQRLAEVLGVDPATLRDGGTPASTSTRTVASAALRVDMAPAAPGHAESSVSRVSAAAPAVRAATGATVASGASRSRGQLRDVERTTWWIEAAFELLPGGPDGRRIRRALLDAIEDAALDGGLSLCDGFFDLRRRVLAGEL